METYPVEPGSEVKHSTVIVDPTKLDPTAAAAVKPKPAKKPAPKAKVKKSAPKAVVKPKPAKKPAPKVKPVAKKASKPAKKPARKSKGKAGAPKLPPGKARHTLLMVRVNKAEHTKLLATAKRLKQPLSTWLRKLALSK